MALSNTSQRIIVSLIAIPFIVVVSYFGKIPFLLFITLIGLISFIEFSRLVNAKDISVNTIWGSASVVFIVINSYFNFVGILKGDLISASFRIKYKSKVIYIDPLTIEDQVKAD